MNSNMPTDDEFQASSETGAAEKVVMDLLRICLERIEWQGEISEWEARILKAVDGLESALISETEPPPMRVTAYQMDCLTRVCLAARTGIMDDIIECALCFSNAFNRLPR